MNRKIPQKHELKKPSLPPAPVLLKLNKKRSYLIRPLAPTCCLYQDRRWYKRKKYVVFVIYDGQVNYLEFSESIYKSFCERIRIDDAPTFDSHPVLRETRPFDPGDSIHGGEWRVYYSKSHRNWRAEFQGESRLSKHHRKIVHEFLRDNSNPFEIFFRDGPIHPVLRYTEKIIPI